LRITCKYPTETAIIVSVGAKEQYAKHEF